VTGEVPVGGQARRPSPTFAELLAYEGVAEHVELRSPFGFLAFHGGLEAGTEVVASQASAEAGASLYVVVQPADLRWHVPSQQVLAAASPALAQFLAHVDIAVAVHGYGRRERPRQLLLGGTNRELAGHIADHLRAQLAEFEVIDDLELIPPEVRGLHKDNPVNVPPAGGVQLELPPLARGVSLRLADRSQPYSPVPGLVAGLAAAALAWPPDRPRRPPHAAPAGDDLRPDRLSATTKPTLR
jgi:phage replication-related protein YjqB (UPF0714/DUF867 family)